MAVTLGKDVTISGIANARSYTVNNSGNEVDVTKFGDTERKFKKTLIEQTCEIECVGDPGVSAGDTFTLGGATTSGSASFVVTSVAEASPIDGVTTWTVSGSRTI